MSTVTFKGTTYRLDGHGFLDPPDQWDEGFAEGMAKMSGIRGGLTQRHWRIIEYLRKKFLEDGTVPVLVLACADNRIHLSELRGLFPTGYHRGACRIAGINYAFMWETNYWLTYETAPPAKPRYELDPMGYLSDPSAWDEQYSKQMGTPFPPKDQRWHGMHDLFHWTHEGIAEFENVIVQSTC